MGTINALLLLVGGFLAVSGLIVAKKPNAKELIDKILPYQAGIGVALLALGLVNLLRTIGSVFTLIRFVPLFGLAWLAVVVISILLGFMFGMPQIAKWLPGQGGAEHKGLELSRKLAPFQVILGIVGIVASLIVLFRIA